MVIIKVINDNDVVALFQVPPQEFKEMVKEEHHKFTGRVCEWQNFKKPKPTVDNRFLYHESFADGIQ